MGIWWQQRTPDVTTFLRNELKRDPGKAPDPELAWIADAWVRLYPDDTTVLQLPSSEMGQGVMTALPMLIVEELDANWARVMVDPAPVHKAYRNPLNNRQSTGGSTSIRGFYLPLRIAGAAIREALIKSAARRWHTDANFLVTENSVITHMKTGQQLRYGELLQDVASVRLNNRPKLKQPAQFRLLTHNTPRLDTAQKINGSAVFGQDVRIPEMRVAVIARCPVFQGSVANFDAHEAMLVPGVENVIQISSGIAVIAKHFWAALQGRNKLLVTWNEGSMATQHDTAILHVMRDSIDTGNIIESSGDVASHLTGSDLLSAEYFTPFLAHACMEPMNCTAWVQADRCDVWAPTQSQGRTHDTAVTITGLDPEQVFVHTTLLGGGFGRRGEQDFVIEAVELAKRIGNPVKVMWTREDDIQHDFYRPATLNRLFARIDANGMPIAWRHRIAGPSILNRLVPMPDLLLRGKDATSTDGALANQYRIPNVELTYAMVHTGIPVGFWRSVGYSQNVFVTECFLDEVARAGNQDPYELRRKLLQDNPRLLRVLEAAARLADWHGDKPEGHFMGIAASAGFGSYVAQVAEVSIQQVNDTRQVKVHSVICAVDCGAVVNPRIVSTQITSGICFGLSAALLGNISIKDGRVQQSNFHDYPCLRMSNMPSVTVHIIDSNEKPGGIGEVGTPAAAPAVANAIFAATDAPVRNLPIVI